MKLHLIPGEGSYKDLPFYVKDHKDIYMLSEPGHHEDIVSWMRENGLVPYSGLGDFVGGQFYFREGVLTFTLFGFNDLKIENWAEQMIPKLIAQGATDESFHDGSFHYRDINPQLSIPGIEAGFGARNWH